MTVSTMESLRLNCWFPRQGRTSAYPLHWVRKSEARPGFATIAEECYFPDKKSLFWNSVPTYNINRYFYCTGKDLLGFWGSSWKMVSMPFAYTAYRVTVAGFKWYWRPRRSLICTSRVSGWFFALESSRWRRSLHWLVPAARCGAMTFSALYSFPIR